MSTTIDTLQIEIQSSSANASKGIRDLAGALGELKTNGTIKVAVKNLGLLSEELGKFKDASVASRSLGKVAGALGKLKEIGSVKPIANSITKLGEALKSVENINVGDIAPKIKQIAEAVAPLSAVKAGGINTMANGLKKLDEVTKKLDDATINRFAERVQKLNTVLEPLSAKMTTIGAGLRAVTSEAKKAGNSVKKAGEDVDGASINFASFIYTIQEAVQWVQRAIEAVKNITAQAIEWDGIAARFGRSFGPQAQETYEWIQKLNEEMGINVQQFMQYSSLYAQMLTGFGVASKDVSKMALGYTELTYDIWAAANDRYKTFEDAAEAVASAIAGEVEPIRRAGFTIVESTLAETAAYHGLDINIEKATESQKSYLRYLTLVDQAHATGVIGTYAKEMNTAEGVMRTLSQQTKSLAQAFGSLLLPVLVRIVPWIQAVVELLTEGVHAIANFFGIEIQSIDWGSYNAGIGNAAENTGALTDGANEATKALKEMKNATLGIDELNIISPPSANSDTGVGADGNSAFDGVDIDSLWDESIFDNIQSQVDSLKNRIKEMLPEIAGVATALAGWSILRFLNNLDDAEIKIGKMKGTLEGLGKGLAVAGITIAVGALTWDFTGAYLESGSMGDLAKVLGTTVLGAAVAAWLKGPLGAGIVIATSGIVSLARLGVELKEGSVEITDPQALTTAIIGGLETVLGGAVIIDALKGGKGMTAIGGAIKSGLETVALKAMYGFDAVKVFLTPLVSSIGTALSGIGTALAGMSGWAIAAVVAIASILVLAIVDYDFTDIGYKLGNAVGSVLKRLGEWLGDVGEWFGDVGQQISVWFDGLVTWVSENLDIKSFQDFFANIFSISWWTDTFFPAIKEIGGNILEGIWQGLEDGWDNFWGNVSEFIGGFVQGFKDALGIHSPSKVFADIGTNIVDGLKSTLSVDSIKEKLSDMWTNAKDWWGDKKENLKTYTPTIGSVKDAVSSAWSSAQTWWDKKKENLKTYTPTIGSIKDKVSSAWTTAKTWYNDKKEKLKEYTPSIGSIFEPLKSRWENAREWYDGKKTKLKEYTPTIGSIYDKVKERWDNAKTWYDKSKSAMKSYTPNIGDIKAAVQKAWNTAKTWWNENVKLSIPSLSFKVTYSKPTGAVKKAIVNALGLDGWPKLSFAANGGMFDMGSLIWAGERGAEIVANAGGGKTGVMNVQQMSEAMYEAVYAAVIAANRGGGAGGGVQAVNVYLDGKQIAATVDKRNKERGASIMGHEVYSY
jgi:hypothetical protein